MRKSIFCTLVIVQIFLSMTQAINSVKIVSPDKKTKIEIGLNKQKSLQYRVVFSGKEAIGWSTLGLKTNAGTLGVNTTMDAGIITPVNERFPWSLGENDTIVNQYNETTVSGMSSGLSFAVQVRVYNGAVAFRYKVSKALTATGNRIREELTSFTFPKSTILYQYNQETVFTPTALDTLRKTSDFPTTLHGGDLFYSIGEAENDWFTKAELKKGNEPNSLKIVFPRDSVVIAKDEFATP